MNRGRGNHAKRHLWPDAILGGALSVRSPFGRRPASEEVFLNAGELVFATRPCMVRTVLGSCVGIALFDPALGIGGMCHYLLADGPEGYHSTRFGSVAIRTLIGKFKKAGSSLPRLRAWMAGGGLLLESSEVFFVGDRNVKVADDILAEFGIVPEAREVGGDRGRRMVLDSRAGEVSISLIPLAEAPRLTIL